MRRTEWSKFKAKVRKSAPLMWEFHKVLVGVTLEGVTKDSKGSEILVATGMGRERSLVFRPCEGDRIECFEVDKHGLRYNFRVFEEAYGSYEDWKRHATKHLGQYIHRQGEFKEEN